MALKSWVASANEPQAEFPLENLPFGIFSDAGPKRIGVAIGDQVLDVAGLASNGRLSSAVYRGILTEPSLNALMAAGRVSGSALRKELAALLDESFEEREEVAKFLIPTPAVTMHLPAQIGDYTDFYAAIHHATNVGSMFRPDNALLPNYKYIPIGYHGRASSIVISGTPIVRPK